MLKNTKAFTIVELIVVITILAVLATIGFVSFGGYLAGTRDTNRISQLKSMSDALELYRTKKDLPIPDDKVDVQASGTTIAYQGYIGANVLETIEYTEKGLDPKDKKYFSYYLTKDKKFFQLMSFLEEPSEDVVASNNILNSTTAVDYSGRYPKTQGKKLGILTDDENTPIQEISSITSSGYLDVATTVDTYNAYFTSNSVLSGSGSKLQYISISTNVGGLSVNCNTLLAKNEGLRKKDGVYLLDPLGNDPFPVYCDMTNAGGGWTLIASQGPTVGSTEVDDFGPITIDNPGKMFSLEKINSIPHYDFGATQKKNTNYNGTPYLYTYNAGIQSVDTEIETNSEYFQTSPYAVDCKASGFELLNGRLFFKMVKISDLSDCYGWYKYFPDAGYGDEPYADPGSPIVNGDLISGGDVNIVDFDYYALWVR